MKEKPPQNHDLELYSLNQLRLMASDFRRAIINGVGSQDLPKLNSHLIKIPELRNGRGIALAIGGTTSLSALWEIDNGHLTLSDHTTTPSPQLMSLDFLLHLIESKIQDQKATSVGLNFAFNMESVNSERTDGLLMKKKVEGTVDERLYAKPIGQIISEELNMRFPKRQFRISAANDSVCLLLANNHVQKESNMCGIVGTGVNFAFMTQATAGTYQAISTESGHFTRIPMTQWDKTVDRESNTPGSFLAEKQIAGRYLFKIFNAIAQEKGLSDVNSTEELSIISSDIKNPLQKLAKVIFQRSAQLTAMKISGLRSVVDSDRRAIQIGMEGSVFWKTPEYSTHVEGWLKKLNPESSINIYPIPDSSLLGASMLANT